MYSADGRVQMSYLAMEDSSHESNGILTVTVNTSLLTLGRPATLEVLAQPHKSKSWFGIYQP